MTEQEIIQFVHRLELPKITTDTGWGISIKVSKICPEELQEEVRVLLFLTNELLSKDVDMTLGSAPMQFFGKFAQIFGEMSGGIQAATDNRQDMLVVDTEDLPDDADPEEIFRVMQSAVKEALKSSLFQLCNPEEPRILLHNPPFVIKIHEGSVTVELIPNVVLNALDYPSVEELSSELTELWLNSNFVGIVSLIWALQAFDKLHSKFAELSMKWAAPQVLNS